MTLTRLVLWLRKQLLGDSLDAQLVELDRVQARNAENAHAIEAEHVANCALTDIKRLNHPSPINRKRMLRAVR